MSGWRSFWTNLTKQSDLALEKALEELETHLLSRNTHVVLVQDFIREIQKSIKEENLSIQVWQRSSSVLEKVIRENFHTTTLHMKLEEEDLFRRIRVKKQSFCISVMGVNGIGKTTTIAKVAFRLQQQGFRVGIAACDTFRSGAIEQLRVHSKALGCHLFEGKYGRDPASVGFQAKKQKEIPLDVILCDTAGRMTSNTNLMKELEKFVRVVEPDLVLLIGEAQTGNDFLQQVTDFEKIITQSRAKGIDALCITKLDTVDNQVGGILSVCHLSKKPILYLGTGQTYCDLIHCSPHLLLDMLFR